MKSLGSLFTKYALVCALMLGCFHFGAESAEARRFFPRFRPIARIANFVRNRCYFHCGYRNYGYFRPFYNRYHYPRYYGGYYHRKYHFPFSFNDYASLYYPEPRHYYNYYDRGYGYQTYVNPGYDIGAKYGVRDVYNKYYLKPQFSRIEYETQPDGKLWWYEVLSNGERNRIEFDAETGKAWGFKHEASLQALYSHYWPKYTYWRQNQWSEKPAGWVQSFLTHYSDDYGSYEPDWRDSYARGYYYNSGTHCANGRCGGL